MDYVLKTDNRPHTIPSFIMPDLSPEIRKAIVSEMAKTMPLPTLYPFIAQDLFHPRFLINCWLGHVYPVGMPLKAISDVHGEEATPLGFAYHDWFHHKINTLFRDLNLYIQQQVSEALFKGNHDVIPAMVSLSVQKYELLMEMLQKINSLVAKDDDAFTGLFFMLHEFPSFSIEMFELSTPTEIVEKMLSGSLSKFVSQSAWNNPDDPLTTDPITGKSKLGNEDIKTIAMERLCSKERPDIFPKEIYTDVGSLIETQDEQAKIETQDEQAKKDLRREWLRKNIVDISVEQLSGQFIDVSFSLKSGKKRTLTYPTLKRKWNNFDAFSGMLKFAGVKLEKPILTSNSDVDREIAIGFIADVNAAVQKTMENVVLKSKSFFGTGGGSEAEMFTTRYSEIEKQINQLKGSEKTRAMERASKSLMEKDRDIDIQIEEVQKKIENILSEAKLNLTLSSDNGVLDEDKEKTKVSFDHLSEILNRLRGEKVENMKNMKEIVMNMDQLRITERNDYASFLSELMKRIAKESIERL